jgi:hypothetical protein
MTNGAEQTRGDELLARVLSGEGWGAGTANDLLNEFFRGYPVENLIMLLQSDDEVVTQSGAWIASELGGDARPILNCLLPLFKHRNLRVRYYSVETVLTAAGDEDGEIVGGAVALITDQERPVRQMAFQLMTRADSSLLTAGVPFVGDPEMAALLEWALKVADDPCDIEARLHDSNSLKQLFAVIAAARIYTPSPQYLQLATSLDDSDAQSFAISELRWLTEMQERSKRKRERAERQGS